MYSFNQACGAVRASHSRRRRAAGVSRRQKHRQLKFESLEDRRVMSVNPVVQATDEIATFTREQALNREVLSAFERSADLDRYTQETLAETVDWVVLLSEGVDAQTFGQSAGINIAGATGIIPDTYVVTSGAGGVDALIGSLSASADVDYFYPLVQSEVSLKSLPNDPYLKYQWQLNNFGQAVGSPDWSTIRGVPGEDINVKSVWEDGITGSGVQIAIVDSGVQVDHPDLVDNIRDDLAIGLGGGGGLVHGTAVAGLAAGKGNNGVGITGVAYNADIIPIDLIPSGNDFATAQALIHQFQEIDIYNNSWGIVGETSRTMTDLGPLSLTALRNSIFFGRGGLGNIQVVASGNEGTSAQYGGFANSRYTIAVSAVDEAGEAIRYANGGASILVAAPSGVSGTIVRDQFIGSGIWTTDLVGDAGINNSVNLPVDIDGNFDPTGFLDYFGPEFFDATEDAIDYTSRFNGTSASAPLVSGVVALMLEANPSLTYRDVQHILVRSARQAVPTDEAWITNLREFQLDPLSPIDQGLDNPEAAGADWPASSIYMVDRLPRQFTNGAGFTVNQGIGSYEDSGLGFGVVDATAAVELAKNWLTVGPQQSEQTWTTGTRLAGKIWGRYISSEETGEFLIPGGITGDGDDDTSFGEYYNQFGEENGFFADDSPAMPPMEDPPFNDRDFGGVYGGQPGIPITVADSMAVEWVEVKLSLGGDSKALDYLRITLVSPDGTNSELNAFGQNVPNGVDHFDGITSYGDSGGDLGTTELILSTNRNWGERTEAKLRVDEVGDPVLDYNGFEVTDGWRLVFENYGDSVIDINNYEVVFHGINTDGTSRIQGAIGIDDNADGFFSDLSGTANNFTRYVGGPSDRTFNPDQESFAGGVIVYVDINGDGVRGSIEPYFQTGADGNYYFDLPPDTYDIRIDGTALPEGLDNTDNMALAQNPITTITVADIGERYTPAQLPNNADVVKLNVLLTPNAATVATTFDISGVVFADLDGNGIQDGDDGTIGNAEVYVDINQNDTFDPILDPVTTTAADGTYSFTIEAPPGYYSVIVRDGTTGAFYIPTNPDDSEQAIFLEPGDVATNVDFGFSGFIAPPDPDPPNPDDPPPIDPATPGAISGIVYVDANGSGTRDMGEGGAAGVTVYLDANGDGIFNVGEVSRTTTTNGSYNFNSLANSVPHVVRIETPPGFSETAPLTGQYSITLTPGQIAGGRDFGVRSLSINDYGDLPTVYFTNIGEVDDAGHLISPIFFLGATVDGELGPQPTAGADGDDLTTFDDEDGVVFSTLTEGDTTLDITVTANSFGGYLQGWMDFNEDGFFDASERIFDNELLIAGDNAFTIDVPANLTTGTVFARFRYGENSIDDIFSPALVGEVEDYAIDVVPLPGPLTFSNGPDFDNDGDIDGFDFLSWQLGFGTTGAAVAADGDSDGDSDVDASDLSDWEAGFGTGQVAATQGTGDYDEDGDTDGFDFLAWQQGFGAASPAVALSDGDGNNNNSVEADDLAIWESSFGTITVAASAAASGGGGGGESAAAASAALPAADASNYSAAGNLPVGSIAPASLGLRSVSSSVDVSSSIAAEVDTQESASLVRIEKSRDRRSTDVASLAQTVQLVVEAGLAKLSRVSDTLFEIRTGDTTVDQPVDLENLGFALRDRALDNMYAKRSLPLRDRFEQFDERDFEVEDAFAVALGEEVDWRFS